ncbi:MAG: DUF2877 domain-containing protein [Aigarchaeota archaeon]|nr:DUF2877 domain-containing protein [Aigarchaeota archaeon]
MIERVTAKSIGRNALLEISKQRGARLGSVAAVFDNTIYIRTDSDELVVVTRKNARSPINVNVLGGSSFLSTTRASADAVVNSGELVLDRLRLSYHRCPEYVSHVDELALNAESTRIGASILGAARVLSVLAQPGCVLDPQSPSHDGARRFLKVAASGESEEQLLDLAAELLGLGVGFTPSGDDFVAGLLASFNVLSYRAKKKPVVIEWEVLRSRTSWISARLIDYMQKRLVDETVERCIRSVAAGEKDAALDAVIDLASRGHTSGADISIGLLFGTSLFLEGLLGGKLFQRLTKTLGLRS